VKRQRNVPPDVRLSPHVGAEGVGDAVTNGEPLTTETVAARDLADEQRAKVERELNRLAGELREGEQVTYLATGEFDDAPGLVVLTNDRLLFLSRPELYGDWIRLDIALRRVEDMRGDADTRTLVVRYLSDEFGIGNIVSAAQAEEIADYVQTRFAPDTLRSKLPVERLEGERKRLQKVFRARWQARNDRLTWGVIIGVALAALAFVGRETAAAWLYVLVVVAALVLFAVLQSDLILNHYFKKLDVSPLDEFRTMSRRETEAALRDTANEIDLARIPSESSALRAEKLFKLHQFELKRYYDQTLRQGAVIFVFGIACILAGFAVIGVTLYVLTQQVGDDTSAQVIVGALGGVGAILADFIAVVYLRMFTDTLRNVSDFHTTLVGTHHLHFGNFLTANITDQDLREKTLAKVAAGLARVDWAAEPSQNGEQAAAG
jgi:hypothetical protein